VKPLALEQIRLLKTPQLEGSNSIMEIGNDYLSHTRPSASPSVYHEYSGSSFE